jgi:hypothetical protein
MMRGTGITELARVLRTGLRKRQFREGDGQRCFDSIVAPIDRRNLSSTSKLTRAYRGPSSSKITWDNFEEDGAWENYIQFSGYESARLEAKQGSEAKLLAAQQNLDQYPKQEPYTFWESYFTSEVKVVVHLERVAKFATNAALGSILQTAPPKIRQEFSDDFVKLRTNQLALEQDVRLAQLCRRIIEDFVTNPLHAQAQAHQLRLLLDETREKLTTCVRVAQERQQASIKAAEEAAMFGKRIKQELRKKQRDALKQQLQTEEEQKLDPATTLGIDIKQDQTKEAAQILGDELERKLSLDSAQSADHEAWREQSHNTVQIPDPEPEQIQNLQPEQVRAQEAEPSQSQADPRAARALRITNHGRVEQDRKNKTLTVKLMEDMSKEHPERWTIEPLRSAIKQLQTTRGGISKIRRRRVLITIWTSRKTWNEVDELIEKSVRNIGEMFSLTAEWRALQYYKAHRYPGMLNERQVELGKQIWEWVQRGRTNKEGYENDDEN